MHGEPSVCWEWHQKHASEQRGQARYVGVRSSSWCNSPLSLPPLLPSVQCCPPRNGHHQAFQSQWWAFFPIRSCSDASLMAGEDSEPTGSLWGVSGCGHCLQQLPPPLQVNAIKKKKAVVSSPGSSTSRPGEATEQGAPEELGFK